MRWKRRHNPAGPATRGRAWPATCPRGGHRLPARSVVEASRRIECMRAGVRVARHPNHVEVACLSEQRVVSPGTSPGRNTPSHPPRRRAPIVDVKPGPERSPRRMTAQERDRRAEVSRQQPIVGGEELDELAARQLQAAAKVSEQAEVRSRCDDAQAGVVEIALARRASRRWRRCRRRSTRSRPCPGRGRFPRRGRRSARSCRWGCIR